MYGHETSIERRYKGFRIYGDARSVHNESPRWFAVGQVFVDMPNGSLYGVENFSDPSLAYEDEELAAWFGLGLAEIVVDHLVPPAEYYLTPMNPAWAVDLLRRGARDVGKLQLVKLYEGMKYLEKSLDESRGWCAAIAARWRATPATRATKNGIAVGSASWRGRLSAFAWKKSSAEMNESARRYRENKRKIDWLRRVLELVRAPVSHSRTTRCASLSSRKPAKLECLRWPSGVHSVNSI